MCLSHERKKKAKKKKASFYFFLSLRRVSLVGTDAEIVKLLIHRPILWLHRELLFFICNVFLLAFFVLWVMPIWHQYRNCIILIAFYSEASLLITEEEKRSLPHMLERVKGCSPTPAPQRLYNNSPCVEAPCALLNSRWLTLDSLFCCLNIQPFIPILEPFHSVAMKGHINLPAACLGWTWDVHLFSSLRDKEPIAMARVKCCGCAVVADGGYSSLTIMKCT